MLLLNLFSILVVGYNEIDPKKVEDSIIDLCIDDALNIHDV